jgi:hypothetical protein
MEESKIIPSCSFSDDVKISSVYFNSILLLFFLGQMKSKIGEANTPKVKNYFSLIYHS